ncbi:MAG: hypothetical protein H0U80_05915 [Solirubrobacterales bacterium]|nr:hypothetical protein [Solirubrobacterales bacterium]
MAIVSFLSVLVGLWASVSLIAMALLAAVYLAERGGWRRNEPPSAPDRTARAPIAA